MPIRDGEDVIYSGEVAAYFYTRAAGEGFVLRGTRSHSNYSGYNITESQTYSVALNGMGANAQFRVWFYYYDQGGTASFNSVTYKTGAVLDYSAAPSIEDIRVPFVALGGG